MINRIFLVSFFALIVSSCAGDESEKVEPLRRTDKTLSCPDIQLEINEADQYKKMAFDKKKLGVKSIVMPLGYIDTYMSADEAIQAADARIQYLSKIYEIKHCDNQSADNVSPSFEGQINQNIQNAMQPSGQTGQAVGYTPAGAPIYNNVAPSYGYSQR